MSQVIASPSKISDFGWLRNAPFDLTLILGVAALAIAGGGAAVLRPDLFLFILLLDLWLLGYHHVIATFTRLAFDKESFQESKFLVLALPLIVFGGTVLIGVLLGAWAVTSVYLYWQWFHYTRQSYGIFRIYSRKAGQGSRPEIWFLYAVPLWGILYRSYQSPDTFLMVPVWTLPMHWYIVVAAGVASAVLFGVWVVIQYQYWRQGKLSVPLVAYTISHALIFLVGYLLIENMDYGWLVLNIWHNAQYILIVWLYNNNRFREGIDSRHWFLSMLSQTRNVVTYFLFCFAVSSGVYLILSTVFPSVSAEGYEAVPIFSTLIIYQSINFHHYLVDGVIWKIRKKRLQDRFQISNA